MKRYSILFFTILFSMIARAQHCNWCFCCVNMLVAEDRIPESTDLAKVYLLDSYMNILQDIHGDTIFLTRQQKPYKLSKHTVYDRQDLPKNETLCFKDFNDSKYFIAIIQICVRNEKSLNLCYDDASMNVKKMIKLEESNFFLLCSKVGHIGTDNNFRIEPKYLEEAKRSVVIIE
jgi:hypothetical protein